MVGAQLECMERINVSSEQTDCNKHMAEDNKNTDNPRKQESENLGQD